MNDVYKSEEATGSTQTDASETSFERIASFAQEHRKIVFGIGAIIGVGGVMWLRRRKDTEVGRVFNAMEEARANGLPPKTGLSIAPENSASPDALLETSARVAEAYARELHPSQLQSVNRMLRTMPVGAGVARPTQSS